MKTSIANILRNQSMHSFSGQSTSFTSVTFPIVNKVFKTLSSNSLVSVIPMATPSGQLFYMDPVYGKGTKEYEKMQQKIKHDRMKARYEKLKNQQGWPKI